MAFMGTIVVSGRARGIVVETGIRTVLGEIARDVKGLSVTGTSLQKKIVRFAKFIGFLVLGSAVAIIILGLYLGMTLAEIFTTAVAASVATVPGRSSHCGDHSNGYRNKPHGQKEFNSAEASGSGDLGEHNNYLF